MQIPKMIIFDYGNTILHEPGFDTLRGEEALFQYIKSNRNNLTAKDVHSFSQKLFAEIGKARDVDLEIHENQFQRMLYEYLEIEFTVSLLEAERIFWDNTSSGAVMPKADTMLDYINSKGIRSGVISNIGFSGAALTNRINRLLPNHKFEFIIASSEYGIRKPHPMIFELALNKSGLSADEVWFCGDNLRADIVGAARVGIFTVWYDELSIENPWKNSGELPLEFEHLHIHDWDEMIGILEGLSDNVSI
ncbi:MAG: HAD family hydrolase [Eubacteriales bacterium]